MVHWREHQAWKTWDPLFTHCMTLETSLCPQFSHLQHDMICLLSQGCGETQKTATECNGASLPKSLTSFYLSSPSTPHSRLPGITEFFYSYRWVSVSHFNSGMVFLMCSGGIPQESVWKRILSLKRNSRIHFKFKGSLELASHTHVPFPRTSDWIYILKNVCPT